MQSRGFTLIELLVVIAIIGILSSIGITTYNGALQRGRVARAVSDLKEIEQAYTSYYINNGAPAPHDHTWDTDCERAVMISGVFTPSPGSWGGPYLQSWPTNPWGSAYHWELWESNANVPDGYTISVRNVPDDEAVLLDEALDDGTLTTGRLVEYSPTAGRIEYYIRERIDGSIHTTSCTP